MPYIKIMIIFAATMKKIISYILLILLGTTVLSSCSMEMFDDESNMTDGGRWKEVIITGLVTDAESSKALEDITIYFKAYPQADADAAPVATDEVHTGNNGVFTIQTPSNVSGNLYCTITAEDPKGIYQSNTKQIIVTWKGTSFDKELQLYVVNDCNFQLRKAE